MKRTRSLRFPLLALAFGVLLCGGGSFLIGQNSSSPGGPTEPIRYVGNAHVNPDLANGGLPLAVGVNSFQVLRASRLYPKISDGQGWTFHHAHMLAYWKGKFYAEFISSPVQENGLPTNVMMATSSDGRNWSMPEVIFPQWNSYKDPAHPLRSQLHERMGFYVAPNGKLLVISHYGLWDNEKNHIFGGPGHVVREVHEDGTLGPIYFVRYGEGWNASNAPYPFYKESPDKGLVQACDALLANPFVTDQWYELENGYPPTAYIQMPAGYHPEGGPRNHGGPDGRRKALSFYTRKDGVTVGLWKLAWTAISTDDGKTWSQPVQAPGVARTFAKIWGQRTSDGRYALAYDPQNSHRWPLAVVTSDDGITFNHMLVVDGEVPLRRYPGLFKDPGPQYVRGITEGNPQPPDGAMWLIYSVDKEDIWVSQIPVPIRGTVKHPVDDTFDNMKPDGIVSNWNIYSPRWAPVEVVNFPSAQNKSLRLKDGDPYDYARAIRTFPESTEGSVSFKVFAKRPLGGELDIDLDGVHDNSAVRISLDRFGQVKIANGGLTTGVSGYQNDQWLSFKIAFNTANQKFSVWMGGKPLIQNAAFAQPVNALERISFRAGPHRVLAMDQATGHKGYFVGHIDPITDRPLKDPAIFYLDDVSSQSR